VRRFVASLFGTMLAAQLCAQDPAALVRLSIGYDRLAWSRMNDYTWKAESVEKHFDSRGGITSMRQRTSETLVLYSQQFSRTLERDGKKLSPREERTEQEQIDHATARLKSETPSERQLRLSRNFQREQRQWAFLAEIPDLFDLRVEGESNADGRPAWLISGAPRAGAQPKSSDAKMLLRIRGRLWIDKASCQWTRVEAETTDTISWGMVLVRVKPGARLIFEQTQVTSDLFFPKFLSVSGKARVGVVKRFDEEQVFRWGNYQKFSVDSKVLADLPNASQELSPKEPASPRGCGA
jgi:hypothetical protein